MASGKVRVGIAILGGFLALAGCGPSGGVRRPPPGPFLVVAHYYPWYETGRAHWPDGYLRHPLLGEYSSSDPKVAARHIAWATQAGLSAFSVSWWGPGTPEEENLRKGLLSAENLRQIRFSLLYETLGRIPQASPDFSDPVQAATLVADLRYLARNFFGHPSYLKIDGRPVVFFYVVTPFWSGDVVGALRAARAAARSEGYDPYFVADALHWRPEAYFTLPAFLDYLQEFDAVTSYNLYTDHPASARSIGALAPLVPGLYRAWREGLRKLPHPPRVHPMILPGYDDTALRVPRPRGNVPLPAASFDEVRAMVRSALDAAEPEGSSGVRVVWLTSWNEWHEGTTVEPTLLVPGAPPEGDYGFGMLALLTDEIGGRIAPLETPPP